MQICLQANSDLSACQFGLIYMTTLFCSQVPFPAKHIYIYVPLQCILCFLKSNYLFAKFTTPEWILMLVKLASCCCDRPLSLLTLFIFLCHSGLPFCLPGHDIKHVIFAFRSISLWCKTKIKCELLHNRIPASNIKPQQPRAVLLTNVLLLVLGNVLEFGCCNERALLHSFNFFCGSNTAQDKRGQSRWVHVHLCKINHTQEWSQAHQVAVLLQQSLLSLLEPSVVVLGWDGIFLLVLWTGFTTQLSF